VLTNSKTRGFGGTMGQTDNRLTYTELQFNNTFHGYDVCIRSGGKHFSTSAVALLDFFGAF
jgi:hypothetical protein